MDMVEKAPEDFQTNIDVIQAINRETVHKICSGQVVLSLAIAVKELVENAIDASATSIEVRLKEYGSDLIEVADNGSGVKKENFAALTLKHYTSKIREFNDLETVCTLGFRGEALSSLCALSNITVTTKDDTAAHATKIEYDHNGVIKVKVPTARSRGTTVSLVNIFATLPVRRKEFIKNLKREFNKMCQLLYAYCLVCKGIKFTCSNSTNKASKNVIVATQGSNTVRENIISVFGAKQISTLIEIDLIPPDETILQDYALKPSEELTIPFTFEFFISSVIHGNGRSTTDRQFYFINGRPCEPTKIIKLVNEIYKQFNHNQYPFVFLNLKLETHQIDVNVTPDKRQIFLEKEKLLLAVIKASLLDAFKNFPSTYKIQNLDTSRGLKRTCEQNANDTKERTSFLESFKKKIKNDPSEIKLLIPQPKKLSENNTLEKNEKKNLNESLNVLVLACELTTSNTETIVDTNEIQIEPKQIKLDSPIKTISKKTIMLDTTLEEIKASIERNQLKLNKDKKISVRFRSQINPDCNKLAEEELNKQIDKSSFERMKIIGQFNLGFIIAKLESDLFIIDQHATDEKYNFEQLQSSTVLETQKLVNPKSLELTAANESLLIENVDVFQKNGFTFNIDENAEATKKVFLTGIPMSRNYIFGKDDIDEMLFMLQDASHTMCRPTRVRSMFASRACRKSVMIGKALSKNEMRKLVNHMGEIDQPWNCPHGRPTMRHLINLNLIQNN